jgi:hypothetical protein
MALNLGNLAFEAAQRLKHTEDWQIIVKALEEQMGKLMHAAIETGDLKSCGYAQGVRDVFCALWVMEAGADAPQRATQKPPLRAKY